MRALAFALCALAAGCQPGEITSGGDGGLPDGAAQGGADLAFPSMSSLEIAAEKYPDLRTLWSRSIARTCGPNNGVCHDNRQFPDLQTASGLLASVGVRCNQIRDDPATIDNLCEPPGDQLAIGTFTTHIGKVTATPPGAPTAVQLTLADPIPNGASGAVSVVRQTGNLSPVTFPVPANAVTSAQAGQATVTLDYATLAATPGFSKTSSLALFFVPPAFLPGDDTQVEMGDPNGDGVFGAGLGGALVEPGDPMKSFLFQRVIGAMPIGNGSMLTNVSAPAASEAQMPIANQQYWDVDNDVIALWCWISRMKPD